jgi:hypothetical protein
MSFRVDTARMRRSLCGVLLLALVVAQTLGALHRIVHAPLLAHLASGSAAFAGNADAARNPGGLAALFSGHASEQGCDLYDQLSHADLLPAGVAPLALPSVVVRLDVAGLCAPALARLTAFHARGPPLLG